MTRFVSRRYGALVALIVVACLGWGSWPSPVEDGDLYADVKEHDGMTWENDVFELFFKPDDNKPGYYEFQVNAAGTIMDMFIPRRGAGGYRRFIKDGDFHLDAKVHLRGTLNKW